MCARTLFNAVGLCLTFVVSVEVATRVDDRVRHGVPALVAPDRDADLVLQDERGILGRPNGRYKQWKLNRFGFRGEDMSREPAPGCIRVMTLGASETFGLYERAGHEYPAQLAERLHASGCFEVVNAAIYGMKLPDIRKRWNSWDRTFRPAVVTIYPTPSFYLAQNPPEAAPGRTTPFPRPDWWQPRSLDRAKDAIEYPEFIQRRRTARNVAAIDASHPPDWFFRTVPVERVDRFARDLDDLVADIQREGAVVLVATHATGFSARPTPEEQTALQGWRVILGRPTTDTLLAFERATQAATAQVAAKRSAILVDLAKDFNGKHELFASDLLHFSEAGSSVVATRFSDAIRSEAVREGQRP